jgi:hypothetical protein
MKERLPAGIRACSVITTHLSFSKSLGRRIIRIATLPSRIKTIPGRVSLSLFLISAKSLTKLIRVVSLATNDQPIES